MGAPRPACAGDAVGIAQLAAELGYPCSEEAIAARLLAMAEGGRHRVWVAEREERLDGWIVAERRLSLEAGERVEITGLVVDSSARRRGVGRALVAAVEAWARDEGLDTVLVRSNVQRTASHPFYEGLGYVRTKSQHVYARPLTR